MDYGMYDIFRCKKTFAIIQTRTFELFYMSNLSLEQTLWKIALPHVNYTCTYLTEMTDNISPRDWIKDSNFHDSNTKSNYSNLFQSFLIQVQ